MEIAQHMARPQSANTNSTNSHHSSLSQLLDKIFNLDDILNNAICNYKIFHLVLSEMSYDQLVNINSKNI